MRVLVTGAAGFLGRNFARHHLQAGHDVVGVDDMSNPHSWWPEELTNRYEEELQSWLTSEHGAREFDRVYHFAAPVGGRVKIEGDPLFNADSLRLDALMFRWAANHTPLLVYPSSSAVYGTAFQEADGVQLNEGMFDPASQNWPAPDEMYGFTKMAGEVLAYKAQNYGLSTLCIRPFSGYGEDQSLEYPIPSIARRAANRENPLYVWGSGMQSRDFVHVDDVVGATLARLVAGVSGYQTMNIGSGTPVTFADIARTCANIVGYSPTIKTDTSKPEGVARRFSNTSRMVIFYKPQVTLTQGLERVVRAARLERSRA